MDECGGSEKETLAAKAALFGYTYVTAEAVTLSEARVGVPTIYW